MSLRELTKERNRAAILDAARAAFSELGYGGTAVRDIVRRTDLSPGTFYNYFPDKESVFLALVEESTARIRALLREARTSASSLEEFVLGAYRAWFGAIMPLAEAQGEWVGRYLTGAYALQGAAELRRDMERERRKMFKRYVASPRHTMQVDYDDYLAELAKERRRGAERARAIWNRLPVPPRAAEEAAAA